MRYVINVLPSANVRRLKELVDTGFLARRLGDSTFEFDSGSSFVLAASLLRNAHIRFTADTVSDLPS